MMGGMDTASLQLLLLVSAWALGAVISLLIAYLVIRLAVTHGLRSHYYWVQDRG